LPETNSSGSTISILRISLAISSLILLFMLSPAK